MFFRRSSPTPAPDEGALIRQYQATGDVAVLGEVYGCYLHLVFGVCRKYLRDEEDSKDAVMAIFEKLVVELRHHQVTNFKGWLHTVARNYCLMELRSRKTALGESQRTLPLTEERDLPAFFDDEAGQRESSLQRLEAGLERLPIEQQMCVRLFYLEDKSYREVAEATGFDLGKVKSAIQNGKRNLKLYLEKQNGPS